MKQNQLAKTFLYSIVMLFTISTLIYYIYFFDEFLETSPVQGIILLLAFVFTLVFFTFFTIDFLKDKNKK